MSGVQPPTLECTCSDSVCNNTEHLHSINLYYDGIVGALREAATTSVVRVKYVVLSNCTGMMNLIV